MSGQLFNRLEKFRKQQKLSILKVCKEIGCNNVTYHRWKKSKQIIGPYKKIVEEFLDKNDSHSQHLSTIPSDIAVIGIACCYPGAHNIAELWENILARKVQFRRILDQRLPLKDYYNEDPKFPDTSYLTKAAFIDGFEFNWSKLRIPKKTFESTDIVHWLALDTALKTFEDAGYRFEDIPLYQFHKIPSQNTGVILGNTLTGEQTRSLTLRLRWPYVRKTLNATLESFGIREEERTRLSEAMEKVYKSAFFPITEDSLSGGLANTIAGRICNYLNLKGGGYIVDGACSSSLLAVATAANALKLGEMDLVLAGGVDVSLDPFELVGFSKAGALAKDQMRVYDQRASGFVPGEGCGFVLLKRLEDAVKDKDYIYAVIKGWGISSDGKGGIMEPSSTGQSHAIQRAYKNAGYTIANVDFIEGHGTGTTKGDRVELGGIAAALKEVAKKRNGRICGITSFKSIVGHTKAAAGIGGFIKAVLAVNQRILPPTANCQQPNEVFEKEARQLYPLINGRVYSPERVVRAGISSAGFGGINCHITVESKDNPHEKIKPHIDERALFVSNQNTEVFVFASRTILLLRKLIQKFKEDLRNISMAEMADLSARLNKKVKAPAPIKIAIVTDSPEHLYEALCAVEKELESDSLKEGQILEVKSKDPLTYILLGNRVKDNRIGFLYSGQGAQRLNMTRTLVERFAWARDLLKVTKVPIGEYIYKPEDQFLTKGEKEQFRKKLSQTEITQPAISFSSLVWTEFLSKLGIEPGAVGGHSLGELLAFYKGGAFDKKTLLKFAELRGRLMASKAKSAGMVSLFCNYSQAEELVSKIKGNIIISNINSPNQTVVSGGMEEIKKVIELAKAENISTYLLPVSNAFHSSSMQVASQKIQSARILEGTFRQGKIDVYSCINGARIENEVNLREYFSRQVLLPVNFIKLIESMSEGCDLFIEVGPGRILTDLVKAINKNKGPECFPLEGTPQNDRDVNVVLAQVFIRNVRINWQELYRNRVIKPFVPVSRRKFIENQCERPLKGVEQKEMFFSKLIAPAPTEAVQQQSFGIVQDKVQLPAPSLATSATASADAVARVLLDLTHKMTGFDEQSLNLNLRLLDDLNLDSIKAAELIAEAGKVLGLTGQIDPSQFSNNTLAQIRDRFVELKSQAPQAVGEADNVLLRYQRNSWVRNFVVKYEEEKIKQLDSSVFKRLNRIDILSNDNQREIAHSLKQILKDKRVEVRIKSYDELDKAETGTIGLICILPANHKKESFGEVALKRITDRFYHVMTTAMHDGSEKEKAVVFVQFGGGSFGENDKATNIESCCARSFASTLHLERPDLRIRVVDFDKNIPADVISKTIVEELQTPVLFSIAGYNRNLTRKVPVFHNTQPALYKRRNIQLSSKDVVLVTGGAKGITAECALEFAKKTKAQMVLVGRSELLPQTKDQDNEIIRTLNRFKAEKLKCQYYSCDVTNLEAVQQLISKVEKDYGKITAVIHGAGLNTLKRLKQTNPEGAYHEALPKVMGAINLCKALEKNPPKIFVGITSVIGVTGMEGSGWYGLANEILNLFLYQFKTEQKETEVVTVAYSVWDEIGMGTKLGSLDWLSQRGISPIPVAEGTRRFMQLVEGDSGSQQTIVVARISGIDTWKSPQTDFRNGLRFIEDVKYCMPGIELIAQAHLNVKDDSYVLDHNWKGTLLFPFVFGLEAMTQVVVYLLGIKNIGYIKVKDINLQRPIPVSPEIGKTVEIHALTLEQNQEDGYQEVKVEIYSQETGYKEPHFSSIFELNSRVRRPHKTQNIPNVKKPIDIEPADIYGSILFQGKSFQCIEQIHKLYYHSESNKGECVFAASYNKFAEDFLKGHEKYYGRFLIGDPFFIDSVLQSMQVIIPQDISLPTRIQTIEFIPSRGRDSLISQSHIEKIDADHYRGDAEVVGKEHWFTINNCLLKVLDTVPDHPSANDLVNPTKRDQIILDENIRKYSRELGVPFPHFALTHIPDIQNKRREERHKIELPFIEESVKNFLKKNKKLNSRFKIKWDKNGKPCLSSNLNTDPYISLTHERGMVLCAIGIQEQAIDLQTVLAKTHEEWRSFLGNKKFEIIKNFTGEDLNFIATAIWASGEVCIKAGKDNGSDFRIEKSSARKIYVFRQGEDLLINIVVRFSRGAERLLAFLVRGHKVIQEPSVNEQLGFGEKFFHFFAEYSGPQQQLVTIQKFPVTFKNNKMKSRRVHFCSYFDWMGEVREFALLPVLKQLADIMETKEWGVATNNVKLDVVGELRGGDIVEARMWLDKKINDNVFDLRFEFRRHIDGDTIERVASAIQRISWVKILGHGKARVNKLPFFLEDIMQKMEPRTNVIDSSHSSNGIKEFYNDRKFRLKNLLEDYGSKELFLSEMKFQTTLAESNLVGNIYFANYPIWVEKTTDYFFYNLWPEAYLTHGMDDEFVCIQCTIDHLNEAMPFDLINVRMFLSKLYENGIVLKYEIYANNDKKLAIARQSLLWVNRDKLLIPSVGNIPKDLINKLSAKSYV